MNPFLASFTGFNGFSGFCSCFLLCFLMIFAARHWRKTHLFFCGLRCKSQKTANLSSWTQKWQNFGRNVRPFLKFIRHDGALKKTGFRIWQFCGRPKNPKIVKIPLKSSKNGKNWQFWAIYFCKQPKFC